MTDSELSEKERLAELYGFEILDTEFEKEFDEIVRLASLICETPISLISLIDKERQWFKSRLGIDVSQTNRDVAFCTHAIKKDELMIVENATQDERFVDNPFVTGDPDIRFYAGMPLITASGHKLGTLCVLDNKPKKLNASQQYSLEILAKQVIRQMEFRKLNTQLKKTSERLKLANEGAHVGTFEYNHLEKALLCDDMVFELFGVKKDKHSTNMDMWRSCIHPADLKITDEIFYSVSSGHDNFDKEFRVLWKDGSTHYIKSKGEVIRDGDGKALHTLGANWDITKEKVIELDLKRRQERDNIFVKQSPNAIAMFDKEMRYMAASQQWIKDYHLEGKEIIGRSHYDIFPEIEESWKAIHRECLTGKINKKEEVHFLRADGSSQWITWDVRPWYVSEGVIGGLLMYTADLTVSKEKEREKLRVEDILAKTNEVARIGTWEINLVSNKIIWSRMIREIHEVDESFEPILETGIQFYPEGENRNKITKAINDVMNHGTPYDLELEILTAKNNRAFVRSIGQAEYENGVCKRVYGIFQDITESKKAKEDIIQAKNLAEQSALLKETFLANMSHEIRTPMNAIVGFTDLLLKKDLQKEDKEYVQIVKNSGENLLRIINDILDVSKINSGMMTFEEHPVNIAEMFLSLRMMLLQKAKEKGLQLVFTTDPALSANLVGDPTRLTQILVNLCGNAIKFTQKGSVRVSAYVLNEDENHYQVEFSVKDTGIGISEDKLPQIFERFSQAEEHTTRYYGGTGLGLSIARQLIELQKGTIEVKSKLGEGSEFVFVLPFKKATLAKASTSIINVDPNHLNTLRILLVDDNPINIKLVQGMFFDYGIKTDVAENGKVAVEKVRNTDYDLVLMDIEMPEMNGYEATKYIRQELKSQVPIIAMSAHAMSEEREKSLRLGMNDYLSKPIKADLLFEKMSLTARKQESAPEKAQDKLVDLSSLKKSMNNQNKLVKEILELFLSEVPQDLEVLSEGILNKDFNAVKRRSHRMKSTILSIGIDSMSELLKQMESLSAESKNMEELSVLNEQLKIHASRAIAEIKEEIKYM